MMLTHPAQQDDQSSRYGFEQGHFTAKMSKIMSRISIFISVFKRQTDGIFTQPLW
jgi:hypothetical protein